MPRPRKDSEILSATERLENAFWELLADHEYRKITVTEVVREAHVNRNSFYYHYASLPELAIRRSCTPWSTRPCRRHAPTSIPTSNGGANAPW